jgi:hypothetical protein
MSIPANSARPVTATLIERAGLAGRLTPRIGSPYGNYGPPERPSKPGDRCDPTARFAQVSGRIRSKVSSSGCLNTFVKYGAGGLLSVGLEVETI